MAENEITTPGTAPAPTGSVTIDGVEYTMEQLSEEARNQLYNLRATDMEITRLKQLLAIVQTARGAYAAALKVALPPAPVVN